MKYIKTFEKLNEPQVGDYVKLDSNLKNYFTLEENINNLENYINNNFGQIIHDYYWSAMRGEKSPLNISFEIKPDEKIRGAFIYNRDEEKYTMRVNLQDIIEFAPTKELLEAKLSAKKYNI